MTASQADLLTRAERQFLAQTGIIADMFGDLMLHRDEPGGQRTADWQEFTIHLHAIQNMVLSQAAARAYPLDYRLLGE